jgi:hypothetical protein
MFFIILVLVLNLGKNEFYSLGFSFNADSNKRVGLKSESQKPKPESPNLTKYPHNLKDGWKYFEWMSSFMHENKEKGGVTLKLIIKNSETYNLETSSF